MTMLAAALLMLLVLLQPSGCSAETRWTTAAELKAGIEDIVANQVLRMQYKFAELSNFTSVDELPCTGSDGPFCNVNEPAFASDNPFLVKEAQHSDIEGTCSVVDRDKCGYPLAMPITGRAIVGGLSRTARTRREKCSAPGVKTCNGDFQFPALSRADTLESQGCTNARDEGICKMNIDPGWVGYSFPEISQYSLSDLRVRQEICTGNYLVDHDDDDDGQRDPYSIAAVKDEYPCVYPPLESRSELTLRCAWLVRRQTNVAFTGMQASGLYRSWPGLYQCLTENTCSGCSDIRFRGW
eukprot:COSAG02_NODE_5575_length_4220_cov_7.527057_2_plen_297_part_00